MVIGREKALLIAPDGEKYPPEEIEEIIAAYTNVFNQIVVYNDMKKHTTALVTLDEVSCKKIFEEQKVEVSTLNSGSSYNFSFTLEDINWDLSNIHGVVFVQDTDSAKKEVLQSFYVD